MFICNHEHVMKEVNGVLENHGKVRCLGLHPSGQGLILVGRNDGLQGATWGWGYLTCKMPFDKPVPRWIDKSLVDYPGKVGAHAQGGHLGDPEQ